MGVDIDGFADNFDDLNLIHLGVGVDVNILPGHPTVKDADQTVAFGRDGLDRQLDAPQFGKADRRHKQNIPFDGQHPAHFHFFDRNGSRHNKALNREIEKQPQKHLL